METQVLVIQLLLVLSRLIQDLWKYLHMRLDIILGLHIHMLVHGMVILRRLMIMETQLQVHLLYHMRVQMELMAGATQGLDL